MAIAKYRPHQDDSGVTSPRALYAGAEMGLAQPEAGNFPFVRRRSMARAAGSTDSESDEQLSSLENRQSMMRVRPVVAVPRFADPDYRLQLLQQWEGTVRGVDDEDFVAILHDLTDPSKPEEEATFPLEEVPDSDRALVEPGAVFYWSIGYRTGFTGQKDRVSQIRFRRLPSWTASERRDAEREAGEFKELLSERTQEFFE